MKGLIHIYCGDGKGKTTAAIGLAVRAAGSGKKVLFTQFMKSGNSSECSVLGQIPGITHMPCTRSFGFTWNMNEEQKKEAAAYYQSFLEEVEEKAEKEKFDLLIMDEFMSAYNHNFLNHEHVLRYLSTGHIHRPENLEIVLTGRDPKPELLELADYVTEMKKIKHPYDQGIEARKGIEW